jgi:hypothetical protein
MNPDGNGHSETRNLIINSQNCRKGEVARLPKELRQRVNEMLDDGSTSNQIRAALGQLGKDLSLDSIDAWRKGGYHDYLREQRFLAESRLRHELVFDLAREDQSIDAFQAAHKIAAGLICEIIAEFGADTLREAVQRNPLNLLRMLNSLSRLTAGGLECERHLVDQVERTAKLKQLKAPRKKAGLSRKTLKEMQEKLNLM